MKDFVLQVLEQILLTLVGAVFTGILWLAKSVYRAKRDIDRAHEKIRALEKLLCAKMK